jgi:hypothetical protein
MANVISFFFENIVSPFWLRSAMRRGLLGAGLLVALIQFLLPGS